MGVTASTFAQTWECMTDSGHTYKSSQDVPSDRCKLAGDDSPYPPDRRKARPKARHKVAPKPGVSLGMTMVEVVSKTSWGRPEHVNRTITRYGVREQWVYGGGNYLYFKDGILTSIQN
jgi:hypothetical protein